MLITQFSKVITVEFNPGIGIEPIYNLQNFRYSNDVFGPENIEYRNLDEIRQSLLDPNCTGPEIVYAIVMDVGKEKDREALIKRDLLFGVVSYAAGKIGREPVRSQGHVHAVSKSCGSSTPEVYEIWDGEAFIYMQETTDDTPGRCYAVYAKAGDVVIVPPYWAHMTVNANPNKPMTFGALCVRDYGYVYDGVRKHHGLAWFPLINEKGQITWVKNDSYITDSLIITVAREYKEFKIDARVPIYTQFENDPDKFLFVSNPYLVNNLWNKFEP